jgi:cytochrome P450
MLDWAAVRDHPFAYYAQLRAVPAGEASSPVVLARYRDVAGALRDPRLAHWSEGGDTRFQAVMGRWVALMDPRRGAALRTHVIAEIGPARLAALAPELAALARALLCDRNPSDPLDVVGALAVPFAREVVARLFGIGDSGKSDFYRLLDEVQTSLFELLMQDDTADRRLSEFGRTVRELAQRADAQGITAALRRAQADGDRIGHSDLGAFTAIFLFAAFDNVGRFLGLAAHCLAERPAVWARLRAAGGPDDTAIDELLRFEGPVQFVRLVARERLHLAGREIAPGEIVLAGIAAANRDDAAFDRPDELRLDRTPNPHLALGTGAMRCIGHALGRLEARLLLSALIEYMPDAAVLTPPAPRRGPPVLRGFASLMLGHREEAGSRREETA